MLERALRLPVERIVIDRLTGQPRQAVVTPAGNLEHVKPILQQLDERKKALALQPIHVEVIRRPIRRRDDDNAALEELLEEPPEDHRIGDVGNLKLVEAEERRRRGDRLGDRRDRIAVD